MSTAHSQINFVVLLTCTFPSNRTATCFCPRWFIFFSWIKRLLFQFFNRKTYRESLPSNWKTLMMRTPNLFTFSESIENNKIVYANLGDTNEVMSNPAATIPDQTTISNANPPSSEQMTSAAGLRKSHESTPVGSSETESTNSQAMEKLVLPWSEKYWNLFITNPKSTVEIWARLIGAEYSVSLIIFYYIF